MEALANKEMRVMMQGAFVLTAASFVAKLLSAIYRVPYQTLRVMKAFMCISRFIQFMVLP